jgi:hypothetical protein
VTDQEFWPEQKATQQNQLNEKVLKAESLAEGNFRRDKFWPVRHQCLSGILEVLPGD